jgi:hypothetical protein
MKQVCPDQPSLQAMLVEISPLHPTDREVDGVFGNSGAAWAWDGSTHASTRRCATPAIGSARSAGRQLT